MLQFTAGIAIFIFAAGLSSGPASAKDETPEASSQAPTHAGLYVKPQFSGVLKPHPRAPRSYGLAINVINKDTDEGLTLTQRQSRRDVSAQLRSQASPSPQSNQRRGRYNSTGKRHKSSDPAAKVIGGAVAIGASLLLGDPKAYHDRRLQPCPSGLPRHPNGNCERRR